MFVPTLHIIICPGTLVKTDQYCGGGARSYCAFNPSITNVIPKRMKCVKRLLSGLDIAATVYPEIAICHRSRMFGSARCWYHTISINTFAIVS